MTRGTGRHHVAEPRAGFAAVLRLRPFAVLYTAETTSIAGDQLARVALAVLVFDRTNSAAATGLTYATTFLPAILGGFVLAGIGDRFSRRVVLVSCNVVRAVLLGVMALPGVNIWLLLALLVVAVFLEPAFGASEVSYLAQALTTDQYRAATGLRMVTSQAAQVLGFALGGVIVAALEPRGALAIDSLSFAVSALLIGVLLPAVKSRPRAAEPALPSKLPRLRIRQVSGLPYLIALSTLAGFFVVPEGLAVPVGNQIGASTATTGLLFASVPLGGAVGAYLLVRAAPVAGRLPIALTMAIGCGLPLLFTPFAKSWLAVSAIWFLSGSLAAYQVEINSQIVQKIPEHARAKMVGAFSAMLLGAQGFGLILFGAVAQWTSPSTSVAVAGGTGAVVAIGVLRLRAVRARNTPWVMTTAPASRS